jgi:hypothetical protein
MTGAPNPWRSPHPFTAERIHAAAIYCSDGRFGEAFDDFLHHQLGLPHYDRFAVPGGAAALAGHISAYREEESLLEQLRFLIAAHDLDRIVLIAHHGCGFYLKKLHTPAERLLARQSEDLSKAAAALLQIRPSLRVDAFMALVESDHVSIDPVPL